MRDACLRNIVSNTFINASNAVPANTRRHLFMSKIEHSIIHLIECFSLILIFVESTAKNRRLVTAKGLSSTAVT